MDSIIHLLNNPQQLHQSAYIQLKICFANKCNHIFRSNHPVTLGNLNDSIEDIL